MSFSRFLYFCLTALGRKLPRTGGFVFLVVHGVPITWNDAYCASLILQGLFMSVP